MKFLYSVFDSKAAVFCAPFTSVNKFTAIRDFQNAANDENSALCKSPDDFLLYEIASFNDDTGEISPLVPLNNLGVAAQFKY